MINLTLTFAPMKHWNMINLTKIMFCHFIPIVLKERRFIHIYIHNIQDKSIKIMLTIFPWHMASLVDNLSENNAACKAIETPRRIQIEQIRMLVRQPQVGRCINLQTRNISNVCCFFKNYIQLCFFWSFLLLLSRYILMC